MKNPIRSLCSEICKVIFRCPYWRKCPHFDRDECAQAWVMNGCGKYRKYETEDGERATNLMQERKQK